MEHNECLSAVIVRVYLNRGSGRLSSKGDSVVYQNVLVQEPSLVPNATNTWNPGTS